MLCGPLQNGPVAHRLKSNTLDTDLVLTMTSQKVEMYDETFGVSSPT